MTRRRFLTVTIGALAFGGLLGAADAPAAPTDPSGISQNSGKVLPAAQRFVILPAFNSDAVLDKANRPGLGKVSADDNCQVERGPSHLHREKCRRSDRLASAVFAGVTQSGGFFRRSSRSHSSTGPSVSGGPVCRVLVGDEGW